MKLPVRNLIYLMVVFAVAAIIAELTHADPILIFVLSALGLIPLAKLIGDFDRRTGDLHRPQTGRPAQCHAR